MATKKRKLLSCSYENDIVMIPAVAAVSGCHKGSWEAQGKWHRHQGSHGCGVYGVFFVCGVQIKAILRVVLCMEHESFGITFIFAC